VSNVVVEGGRHDDATDEEAGRSRSQHDWIAPARWDDGNKMS
jgi:hypothetical protein